MKTIKTLSVILLTFALTACGKPDFTGEYILRMNDCSEISNAQSNGSLRAQYEAEKIKETYFTVFSKDMNGETYYSIDFADDGNGALVFEPTTMNSNNQLSYVNNSKSDRFQKVQVKLSIEMSEDSGKTFAKVKDLRLLKNTMFGGASEKDIVAVLSRATSENRKSNGQYCLIKKA